MVDLGNSANVQLRNCFVAGLTCVSKLTRMGEIVKR